MSLASTSTFRASDATIVFLRQWVPTGEAVGAVLIAHGMGEHSARYGRLAEALGEHGWIVWAPDLRGHGQTALGAADGAPAGTLGDLGPAGWDGLVRDLVELNGQLAIDHPGLPRVLLGHSMGSFAAQQFVLDHSRDIDGLVLSGTTALDLAVTTMDPATETDLTGLNAAFEPARTPFDWLSRDTDEVDRYIADPLCGFGLDGPATATLIAAAPRTADPAALAQIRPDLPVYLVAGSADPLNLELALIEMVTDRYREAGITDLTTDFHPGARHEVFNETDRDEVTAHLVDWLARFVAD
jgi:alpha-beta hydrolase superfamily lysophospholipase